MEWSGPTIWCPETEEDTGSLKARWMDWGRTEREYRRVGMWKKVFFYKMKKKKGIESKRERGAIGMKGEMIIGPHLQVCLCVLQMFFCFNLGQGYVGSLTAPNYTASFQVPIYENFWSVSIRLSLYLCLTQGINYIQTGRLKDVESVCLSYNLTGSFTIK